MKAMKSELKKVSVKGKDRLAKNFRSSGKSPRSFPNQSGYQSKGYRSNHFDSSRNNGNYNRYNQNQNQNKGNNNQKRPKKP